MEGPTLPLTEALALDSGTFIGVAFDGDQRAALATTSGSAVIPSNARDVLAALEADHGPRWVWWGRTMAERFAASSLRIDRCWDLLTVHRLLVGGWRTSVAEVWAVLQGLPVDALPQMGQMDLLGSQDEGDDPESPTRPDGHLRPEWIADGWGRSTQRMLRWAELTVQASVLQRNQLASMPQAERLQSTARSESMADYLCVELERSGLPVDEAEARQIIEEAAGPRPRSWADEDVQRARRDADVLQLLDPPQHVNLRNPAEVKSMLRRCGIDLPDTRAWRLEELRGTEPMIDALLRWRKDERIATTYGWHWMDEHIRSGRLRGDWTSSDGAAGRMTASAGLHNLPAPMRPAVSAEHGHIFVRADLGQIEPRVLAAVSGDRALIEATREDDLYQPVAERLSVTRDVAKVAVLGAMYGATTGESAGALQGLRRSYPTAMEMLETAAEHGRRGEDIFTIGGRRVRMGGGAAPDGDLERARSAAAGRGRYARNALIQGAAAEFFKVWAIIVRRRARPLHGEVVLCLHDELLIHAPAGHASDVANVVSAAIGEAAHHWSPEPAVRFLADVSVVQRWSEAK